jgi:hypothetical protein
MVGTGAGCDWVIDPRNSAANLDLGVIALAADEGGSAPTD